MDWVKLILSILAGLLTAIPLVVELIKYVQQAVKEKNWRHLLTTVLDLMTTAEVTFETGEQRKKWVVEIVQKSAEKLNYDVDVDAVSSMIDELCKMSKIVNCRDGE